MATWPLGGSRPVRLPPISITALNYIMVNPADNVTMWEPASIPEMQRYGIQQKRWQH